VKRTLKPTVAGILEIVAGLVGLQCLFGVSLEGAVFWAAFPRDLFGADSPADVFLIIVLPLVCLSLLALVGGILTLRRKKWKLSLAAAIAAIVPFLVLTRLGAAMAILGVLGAVAIVLLIQSRAEFTQRQSYEVSAQ
jgi:uncharacterized membrane protein (UPF0136 family)